MARRTAPSEPLLPSAEPAAHCAIGVEPIVSEPVKRAHGHETLSLHWRDVQCSVEGSDGGKADGGEADGRPPPTLPWRRRVTLKRVLHSCWGEALPGEILAVMGPSGAGKTTLLNLLADRPSLGAHGSWSGSVLLNGRPPVPHWKRSAAYVMQKDIFFERLTVEEHLRCTATLRLPVEWRASQKEAELQRVVRLLQLRRCLRTMVGSHTVRGLSGGELKRLNIATELLSRPKLLFLDEPLTGLDSTLATTVLDALREIASSEDAVNVILTVHQPSTPIWQAFDKLLLMAPGGHMAYFGSVATASGYFASLGMPCEPGWSEQDFFVQLVSDERCAAVVGAFAERFAPPPPPPPAAVTPRAQPAFALTVRTLLRRALKNVLQNFLKPLEWALTLLLAIVFGLLWWQVGADIHRRTTDYISIIFFFVAQWSWAPLFQVITNFPLERDVLTRERASESYAISGWYLAKLLSELPLSWILPSGFFVVCYPMVGLPTSQIATLFGITLLNVEVASAVGCAISAAVFDGGRANTLAIVFMCFVMCSGGYFVNMLSLPQSLRWIRFSSFWYYSLGLWTRYAIPDAADRAPGSEVVVALEKYSFSKWSWEGHPEYDVAVLLTMALVARLLGFVFILNSKKLRFS